MDKLFAERRKAQLVQEGREGLARAMEKRAKEKPVHRTDLPAEEPPELEVARRMEREKLQEHQERIRTSLNELDDMLQSGTLTFLPEKVQEAYRVIIAMPSHEREEALFNATQVRVDGNPSFYNALSQIVRMFLKNQKK